MTEEEEEEKLQNTDALGMHKEMARENILLARTCKI